jgi:hypothetical protein
MSRTGWPSKIARKGALPSTVEGHRPNDEQRSSRQVIVPEAFVLVPQRTVN